MTPVVLLTRPEGSNEELAAALRQAAISVRICPALKLVPLMDDDEILDAWDRWRRRASRGLVVITSVETVKLLRAAGVQIDVPVAAVGPASASAVRAAGWEVLDVVAVSAASLAGALDTGGHTAGRDVWLPQSADANPDLAVALEKTASTVTATPLYRPVPRTAELRAAVSEGDVEVGAFFSGSAVRALAAAAPRWRGRAVCIGGSTAAVAALQGWEDILVASAPTDEAVKRTILDAVAPTGKG